MVDRKQISEALYRLKREEPFREFDIVTLEGRTLHVWNRFRFTYNELFVMVGDERERLVRLPMESITGIQERQSAQ